MQHCQKLAPEFDKAALGVYPMIPFYAVDCDKPNNKKLCAEQGVQGFPTLKACRALVHPHPAPIDHPVAIPARWPVQASGLRRSAAERECALLLGLAEHSA